MARVPDDDTSTPDPAPATAPFDPLAVNQAVDFQTELPEPSADNEAALRAAAAKLGMNFENASPDELEFFSVFAGGDLDSIVPDADADNPLIPGDGPTTTTPVAPDAAPTTDSDAPPPDAGADARVGPATTPDDGGQPPNDGSAPTVLSPPPAAVTPPPGLPAFDIPSTLPPRAPAPAEPAPEAPEGLVQLADGSLVTLSTYQALVAQQQQQPPSPAVALVQPPAQQPNMPTSQVPNAWTTTPGEYVDERAALEIQAMQQQQAQMAQQFQQLQQQNAQAVEMQRQARMQSIAQAAEETKAGYGVHRGLTTEQADALMDNALQLGMVGLYSQMYPEDPRRAVAAALENVYWQTPELRDAEVARQVEATRLANVDAERKRALAGQTVSTPGSVSRVAAPARTASERDAGMVAMIEADPTFVARQNGAR